MIGDTPFDIERAVDSALKTGIPVTFDPRALELLGRIRDNIRAEYLASHTSEIRYVRRVPVRRYLDAGHPEDAWTVPVEEMSKWRLVVNPREVAGGNPLFWKRPIDKVLPDAAGFLDVPMLAETLREFESVGALDSVHSWAALIDRLEIEGPVMCWRIDAPGFPPSPQLLLFGERHLVAARRFHGHLQQIGRLGKHGSLPEPCSSPGNLLDFGLFIADVIPDRLLFDASCYFSPMHSAGDIERSERTWGMAATLAWRSGGLDWPEGDYFVCLNVDARSCAVEMLDRFIGNQLAAKSLLQVASKALAEAAAKGPRSPSQEPSDTQFSSSHQRELDIIDVIRSAGKRLTVEGVQSALAAAGKGHGDSTVRNHLPQLVRDAKLNKCDKCRPRGYGLPDWKCPHSDGLSGDLSE